MELNQAINKLSDEEKNNLARDITNSVEKIKIGDNTLICTDSGIDPLNSNEYYWVYTDKTGTNYMWTSSYSSYDIGIDAEVSIWSLEYYSIVTRHSVTVETWK